MTSQGFGGQQFWELLRNSTMEREVRSYFTDAKSVLPKRGGAPLQVSRPALWSTLLQAVDSRPDPLCRTPQIESTDTATLNAACKGRLSLPLASLCAPFCRTQAVLRGWRWCASLARLQGVGMCAQVEAELQLARLLAGLHGTRARREVSEMASNVMEAGLQLTLLDDRLTVMMEAAQVRRAEASGTLGYACLPAMRTLSLPAVSCPLLNVNPSQISPDLQ